MKRLSIALIASLLSIGMLGSILFYRPSSAQAPTTTPVTQSLRTITVSGTGQVNATPDTALITLGVRTEANTASEAISSNNQQIGAVINALEAAGVSAQDIQTQTLNLQPRYQNNASNANGEQQVTGYIALNTVQVHINNLSNLGTTIDQAVQAGANVIQNIQFVVSNQNQLLDQAYQQAMQNTTHKATLLSNLAGASLGEVQTINETSSTPIPIVAAASGVQAGVPVQPGSQTLQVNIQVTWQLQTSP